MSTKSALRDRLTDEQKEKEGEHARKRAYTHTTQS